MRYLHHGGVMILQLRSFLVVIEEGSLHLAAKRLNLSQSALSRQMQALEYELGGKLLERSSTGVRPTVGGHALTAKVRMLLGSYDSAMLEVRRLVRGQSEEIRIGYLASVFEEYLQPAIRQEVAEQRLTGFITFGFPAPDVARKSADSVPINVIPKGGVGV